MQPKAIAHPIDSQLLNRAREQLVDAAQGAGIELRQSMEWDAQSHLIAKVNIEIVLPASFPEKYRAAVVQAAQACTVKKHLQSPPEFNLYATVR